MEILNRRPIVAALAGPNGAGKTSFYRAFLQAAGLRFVNADVLAHELDIDAYEAAELADEVRRQLVASRESFIFETVFSDPVGDKLRFLKETEQAGYTVALFFIGVDNPGISDQRIAMRVLKGGHDVPTDKVAARFGRTMENLRRALIELSNVRVYDNSDLGNPYQLVALRENHRELQLFKPAPKWLLPLLAAG
jgi:predicted ABC-type ATPase